MNKDDALVVFQDKKIRRVWHEDEWYFSVIDVVEVLTDSSNPRNYWSMLKKRESEQGIELSTLCVQLKLTSADGKTYKTDCVNTENAFRIIQSIPSAKAGPLPGTPVGSSNTSPAERLSLAGTTFRASQSLPCRTGSDAIPRLTRARRLSGLGGRAEGLWISRTPRLSI